MIPQSSYVRQRARASRTWIPDDRSKHSRRLHGQDERVSELFLEPCDPLELSHRYTLPGLAVHLHKANPDR